jgi:4-hydroxybenzoate polyprenyltransferase
VNFESWMLAFHLLSAFAVAAALVLFSVMVYSGRRMTTLEETRLLFRVGPLGTILIGAGIGLTFVFGVILAVHSNTFNIWDGWVIAGIVLWAAFAAAGQRTGKYYTDVQKLVEKEGTEAEALARLRAPTGALLHLATVGLFVLILLDMIFKPGA